MLVNSYSDDLYRYAFWLCRDQSIAEDLVQETFTRAWKSIKSLRDEPAAKQWLITILRRENARRFERAKLHMVDTTVDSIADNRIEYDTRTEAHVIRQALGKLANEYKEPLLLQIIGGFSCKDISKELGISVNAVMTRVFRAKQKLRQCINDGVELNNEVIDK